jgi:hypothetical protein
MLNQNCLSDFSMDQLLKFQTEVKNRISVLSRPRKEQIKLEYRRKIIVGGWILKNAPEIVSQILPYLEREQDKVAFQNWQNFNQKEL